MHAFLESNRKSINGSNKILNLNRLKITQIILNPNFFFVWIHVSISHWSHTLYIIIVMNLNYSWHHTWEKILCIVAYSKSGIYFRVNRGLETTHGDSLVSLHQFQQNPLLKTPKEIPSRVHKSIHSTCEKRCFIWGVL